MTTGTNVICARVDLEERIVHQMCRVLSGELPMHLAAAAIGLMPSEFLPVT